MVKLLVQSGADPSAERGQQTPLEIALEYRQFEIYNFLEGKNKLPIYFTIYTTIINLGLDFL